MAAKAYRITVTGIAVDVVRKPIRNLNLRVGEPDGLVRVSAPLRTSEGAIRAFVASKLEWIKQHQARFAAQPRQSREMIDGEMHYFLGGRLQLRVHERSGPSAVALCGIASVDLFIEQGMTRKEREAALLDWYREQLSRLVPQLISKWEKRLSVRVAAWCIKRMRTRWGSCNPTSRRVSLNLELAMKPARCLEYVVVHELLHMHERGHNRRFKALLDAHLPDWRNSRALLSGGALVYDPLT